MDLASARPAVSAGPGASPAVNSAPEEGARSKRERLLEIYTNDAAVYTIYPRRRSERESGGAGPMSHLNFTEPNRAVEADP